MGNISKRFLSLLVAVVMVVAMIPASVFGRDTPRRLALSPGFLLTLTSA